MSLDTETLSTFGGADLVSRVADRLGHLPKSQRAAGLDTIIRNLHRHSRATMELKYAWPLHARDSQLPPPGDWDTWLILAGRGFGKTRTGAEWVRAQSLPRTPIRGPRPPRTPNSPRRTYPPRSTVHADESGRLSPNSWALRAIHLYDKFNATMNSRRGQRRRPDGRVHHPERRRTHPPRQDSPRPSRQVHQGRTRRLTLRTEPAPYPDTGAASTTSAASPTSKTRCVPGTPTSAPSHSPDRADALVHAVTQLILNRNPIMIW